MSRNAGAPTGESGFRSPALRSSSSGSHVGGAELAAVPPHGNILSSRRATMMLTVEFSYRLQECAGSVYRVGIT